VGSKRLQHFGGDIRLYDAIGQDSSDVPNFVRHIGLSLEEGSFTVGDILSVRIVEMIPPLSDPEDSTAQAVDVVASIELNAIELRQIKAFVNELISEYQLFDADPNGQYHIFPHFVERDGDDSCRRFSCAGFVVNAYGDAGVLLIDFTQLPDIGLETLVTAYPDQDRGLRIGRYRAKAGLVGDGPWPVLLPGYVFHSMNRDPDTCRKTPYTAQAGDECFPASTSTAN